MKKAQPASALNTSKGVREVAAWLRERADAGECSGDPAARIRIGCLAIQDTVAAHWKASDMLKAAVGRGLRDSIAATNRDAVKAYGSEVAGAAAIRRQLVQAPDMEPASVKRAERALAILERGHFVFRKEHKATRYREAWEEITVSRESARLFGIQPTWRDSKEVPVSEEQLADLKARGFIFSNY